MKKEMFENAGNHLVLVCDPVGLCKGEKVIARNDKDGLYHMGIVRKCIDYNHSLVLFGSGERLLVQNRFVIPVTSDGYKHKLKRGDYVLAKFETEKVDCFVPGIITVTPKKSKFNGNEFEVQNFDDNQMLLQRDMLFKIDRSRSPVILRIGKIPKKHRRRRDQESSNDSSSKEDMYRIHKVKPLKHDEDICEKEDIQEINETLQNMNEKLECLKEEHFNQRDMLQSHAENLQVTLKMMEMWRNPVPIVVPKKDSCMNTTSSRLERPVVWLSPDEGWYYRGTVKESMSSGKLSVLDYSGILHTTIANNVIDEKADARIHIKVGDKVVATYPMFANSFAPATVTSQDENSSYSVSFYDGSKTDLPRDSMYWLNDDKYDEVVDLINKSLSRWVGETIIARCDSDGCFYICSCREKVGPGKLYNVQWTDGSRSMQTLTCMFGPFTKRRSIQTGDFVLANSDGEKFLPGRVSRKHGNIVVVNFCNGLMRNEVNSTLCFWISKEYYDYSVAFYRNKLISNNDGNDHIC